MLLLVLLHKEDIEDLKEKTSLLDHLGKYFADLLLAHQAVVDGFVGAVTVESHRNVILESELLHQHGLLQ